MTACI